ncbi:MAG: hypothetical protein HC915_02215 [Anaerolineae bacterium]|nr:hypothetical protein [Anaerolineae bacterium]
MPSYSGPSASVQVAQQQGDLPAGYSRVLAALSAATTQYYLPANIPLQQALLYFEQQSGRRTGNVLRQVLLYQPFLLAQCEVRYMDRKLMINKVEKYAYHVLNVDRSGLIHWEQHAARPMDTRLILREPETEAAFGEPDAGLLDKKRMTSLEKEVVDYIYKTAFMVLPVHDKLKIYGQPGMTFADFQAQVHATARQLRDQEIDKTTQRYAQQFDKLADRYTDLQRELEAQQAELQGLGRETLATLGEAAVGLFQGRTQYTISRVTRVQRFREQAQQNISDTSAELREVQQEMSKLQQMFEQEIDRLNQQWAQVAADYREERVTPLKKDIHIELFGIGWKPIYYVIHQGGAEILPAWQGQLTAQVDYNRQGYQAGQGMPGQLPPGMQSYAPPQLPPPQAPGYGNPSFSRACNSSPMCRRRPRQ